MDEPNPCPSPSQGLRVRHRPLTKTAECFRCGVMNSASERSKLKRTQAREQYPSASSRQFDTLAPFRAGSEFFPGRGAPVGTAGGQRYDVIKIYTSVGPATWLSLLRGSILVSFSWWSMPADADVRTVYASQSDLSSPVYSTHTVAHLPLSSPHPLCGCCVRPCWLSRWSFFTLRFIADIDLESFRA